MNQVILMLGEQINSDFIREMALLRRLIKHGGLIG